MWKCENVEMWKWRKSRESGVGSSESENVINMVGSEQYMNFDDANDTGAFGKIMFSYLCGVFGLEEVL